MNSLNQDHKFQIEHRSGSKIVRRSMSNLFGDEHEDVDEDVGKNEGENEGENECEDAFVGKGEFEEHKSLRVWLQHYRQRFDYYWNSFSHDDINNIITHFPCTLSEIEEIPNFRSNINDSSANHLLATLYAWLTSRNLLYRYPDFVSDLLSMKTLPGRIRSAKEPSKFIYV